MEKRIGAQMYTLRDFTKTREDFEETCKKLRDIGYTAMQISGGGVSASDMHEICEKYGLEVYSTHRSFDDFVNNVSDVIEYNKILGSSLCGLGMMPLEYYDSVDTVRRFISEINPACEQIKKAGMTFVYHNHAAEFIRRGGKFIFDYLIEETDPEVFNFTVDTYWCHVAGIDSARLIRRLGKRAELIHFKDLKMTMENRAAPTMAEVGNGNLDWDDIFNACEESGAKFAVVEQDFCDGDPFDSLKMSYDFLKSKGFK